jgi:hypothetical protein
MGKSMSDAFPIRSGLNQVHCLSPLIFNFTLEYAIRMVEESEDGLELYGTHRFLLSADEVHTLH